MTTSTPERKVSRAPQHELACRPVQPERKIPDLKADARTGLLGEARELPAKYFYDERGSLLFDQICDSPEYYPTRAEASILKQYADDIVERAAPEIIVELGSGTSRKTRYLLDACYRAGVHPLYRPFDVCEEVLLSAAQGLGETYPWLRVEPLLGDYMAGLAYLPASDASSLYVFLGGTIGNFEPEQAREFLIEVRERMNEGDSLLIGADRMKDPAVLHAAYNDEDELTAAFNLNVLRVLNRELGAQFEEADFAHHACFNPTAGQIEMYLVAMRDQSVPVSALGTSLEFQEGDQILTEISRKFTRRALESLLTDAGFVIDKHYQADAEYFSLVLARAGEVST